MSKHYLTPAERLTACLVALEELIQQLAVQCQDTYYLILDLETALGGAGINKRTYPEIAERVRMLRELFADYAVQEGFAAPTLAEIAERIRDRRGLFEE